MRRWLVAIALGAASAGALAQAFPSKPVKVVVPYTAGGVVDIIARAVGERAAPGLGQPVVVENRTGAAGNIGTEAVAQAAPDGHTLVLASPSHTVNVSLYPKLAWHPIRSFEPVIMVGVIPNLVVVHPSVPARSLAEFVALAKSRPGQLNYASAGAGSSVHLATEMLKQSGCSPKYEGLYRDIAGFKAPSAAELATVPADLPAYVSAGDTVEHMAKMSRVFEGLAACRKAGWKAPAESPDVSPPHQARILWEHFAELRRTDESKSHGDQYMKWLESSEKDGVKLEEAIRAGDPAAADAAMDAVKKTCDSCHKKHRDN